MTRALGRLGLNTVYASAALGLRALLQAAYLILLSRWMGPGDYGLFAGSVAATVLLAPLSGWGIQYVIAERVGRDAATKHRVWASALRQVAWSGGVLSVVVLLAALAMADRLSLGAMSLLVAAELLLVPATQAASMLLIALERGAAGAVVVCLVPAFRLAAVAMLVATGGDPAPSHVAAMHVLGSVLGAACVFLVVRVLVGRADWRGIAPPRELAARGHGYALGMLSGTSYTEVDKVLLLQIAGAAMAGLYTAAFRVAAVLVIPVSALTANALPRMFGAAGSPEWTRVFRAVGLAAAAYAILAMGIALAVAPWLPAVFGADYAPSSALLRILAAWVGMCTVHQVAGAGLTSIGRQGTRVAIEACGLAAIVALNLALLPGLGAAGAAWSLLAAESAIAVALAVALARGLPAQSRPQTR